MLDPRTPVLVGGAQFTQRTSREGQLAKSLNPIAMMTKAASDALADAGIGAKDVDTVAVVRFTADAPGNQGRLPKRMFRNPPLSVAKHIGANPRRFLYTMTGGNTPQWLVNRMAEDIANGECDAAVLVGAEYIATLMRMMKDGVDLGWGDLPEVDPGSDPEEIGEERPGVSPYERAYALHFPVNTYPLFENAIRGTKHRTPQEHMKWLGEFCAPFTKVAAENPFAWFPIARSPEEISTPAENNRIVGFPYTKYMNAVIEVDMGAGLVMTSVEKARALGIPENKWVFLHGCADANDIWYVTERADFHSSPAIRTMGWKAFAMAGIGADDLSFIDLYSCFPSAVEIGCQELGIAENDPRGLTVTGGLPYFGGPGNNYVMHSIVTMMEKLRGKPGAFGLCTGNGWYVTKHSAGIYSTKPFKGPWRRENSKAYQIDIDAGPHAKVAEKPEGEGVVETYTVASDRKGRRFGIIVGRLNDGSRFLASTPGDEATLAMMTEEEILGRRGIVAPGDYTNQFRFA